MTVLLTETEVRSLTKKIKPGGTILPQTTMITSHRDKVIVALKTNIIIITETGIAMMAKIAAIMIEDTSQDKH